MMIKIAYFCMEFALNEDLHIYSGGLGVLAGDTLLEANQQQFPLVAVGLFYPQEYRQQLSDTGELSYTFGAQHELTQELNLITENGKPVSVSIPFQDQELHLQAWLKNIGSIDLILLDTHHPDNPPEFQNITDSLYSGNKEHRLVQEIVLGIGGLRFLKKLDIHPEKIHLNEGHSALCAVEAAIQYKEEHNVSMSEAMTQIKSQLVFTNHTLISAGNDVFSPELLTVMLSSYATRYQISVADILELGKVPDSNMFSMTLFALRTTSKANAVSVFHAEQAKLLWPDFQFEAVTNGIFLPRWYAHENAQAWPLESPAPSNPNLFWQAHLDAKERMLKFVSKHTGKHITPHSLILTWARRFVEYKRPRALFWQLDTLERICKESPVPIHFLFAGKGHQHDTQAQEMVRHVLEISQTNRFKKYLTYVPNYNLEVAEQLVQGSDVWLNTPVEGFEACGTSGMKAALNGVLQCTTNDGWVREVDWTQLGWMPDNDHLSESLYKIIEEKIIPEFSDRDANAVPQRWLQKMIGTSEVIRKQYSTTRMLKEYQEKLYA